MKVQLSRTSKHGKAGKVVDVEYDLAQELLSHGMANGIPAEPKPKMPIRPMRMEEPIDVETIAKRGTDDAVIVEP